MLKEMTVRNRSYRRFRQEPVSLETLRDLVDLARHSASGANLQPLKYMLSCGPQMNSVIAPFVGLGGNPPAGERPTAYIIILGDKKIRESFGCDHGIAAQSILLGATEKGLGGCIVGNIKRDELRQALTVAANLDILLVLAIGIPNERSVIETKGDDGSVKTYVDPSGLRHVPKRPLQEIIVSEFKS